MLAFNTFLKRSITWSLFLCLLNTATIAQEFEWALSVAGLGLDVGRAVTTDHDGNVILVGSFAGGTNIAGTYITGYGSDEAFVAKFTPQGEMLWVNVISGPEEDLGRGVVADAEGNIVVVGHFTDSVVFEITPTDTFALGSDGGQDAFVVKYAPDGSLLWYTRFGGTGDDTATDIDWYQWNGRFYVSGGFQDRGRFGAQSAVSVGHTDAFLVRLDGGGNVDWVRTAGGQEHDVAATVAVDRINGDVFIAGDFYDHANIQGTALQALGSSDMFVAKFNEAGTMQWAVNNGGTSVDVATSIGVDFSGKAYVTGYYQGTTHFQNFSATALDYNDVFLARFDQDGNCDWLSSAGSWGLDNSLGLAVTGYGVTYLTGMFESEMFADDVTFEGDGYDIFVLCYEPSGDIRYGRKAGAGSSDFGVAACLGPDESLYLTGYYFFFSDFDNTTLGPADHGDCFLAKLTDIVGISDETEPEATNCMFQEIGSAKVSVPCIPTGNWELWDRLGKRVASGNYFDGTFTLPNLPTGIYQATVIAEGEQMSLPVFLR